MATLRWRICRLRSLEATEAPPEEWMEWEKTWYPSYRADVAHTMAELERHVLRIRPGVSLFFLSVAMSSVPVIALLLLRTALQYALSQS
ncbi:hypothetical protein KP509_08G066900 [Ceratopteris richardii]|nr:hypothetical protein KP509_08G066900 [Ceratopteris richardii]